MSSLPTPSLTATITPPMSRANLGKVMVHGYAPLEVVEYCDPGDPRAYGNRKRRKTIVCHRCGIEGHNTNNRKHHPRPL